MLLVEYVFWSLVLWLACESCLASGLGLALGAGLGAGFFLGLGAMLSQGS